MTYYDGAKLIADRNAEVGEVIDELGALMKQMGTLRHETVKTTLSRHLDVLNGASLVVVAVNGRDDDPTAVARRQFVAAADRYADLLVDAIMELKTMRDKAQDVTGHMADASVRHADMHRRIPSN